MRHFNDIELLAQLRGRTTDLGYPRSGSPVVRRRRALIDALVGRNSDGHFGHSRGQGVISWVFLTKTAKSQFCNHFKRRKRSTLIWPLAVNRRARKTRGSALGFGHRMWRVGRISHRKGNATRGRIWRRLIMLIFAGWVPHFICPSRGCLVLRSEITRRMPT